MGKVLHADSNAIVIDQNQTILSLGVITQPVTVADLTSITNATLTVPDIATLKALPTAAMTVGTERQPLNYHANDGTPLPIAKLVNKGGTTTDDFLTFDSDDPALMWEFQFSGAPCLNWAGLYRDGVTDDGVRLIEAWDVCVTLGYRECYVLPGDYHSNNRMIFTTPVNGQPGYVDHRNFTFRAPGATFDNTIVQGNSEGISFKDVTVENPGLGVGFQFIRTQHCFHERLSAIDCTIGFLVAKLSGHKENAQVTRTMFSVLQAVRCTDAAFEVKGGAEIAITWFNHNWLHLIATECNFGFRYSPATSTDTGYAGDPRSRCNYNTLQLQIEIDGTNVSCWLPEGTANLLLHCHLASKNGAGQSLILQSTNNTIIGGRITGTAVLEEDSGSLTGANYETGGWLGRLQGYQTVESDRVEVKDYLFNHNGWSTLDPTRLELTPAGDGTTGHIALVSLNILPAQVHGHFKITLFGRKNFTASNGSDFMSLTVNANCLHDDVGGYHTDSPPAHVESNVTSVTAQIVQTNKLRIAFNTAVSINSLNGFVEYMLHTGNELV